MEQLLRQVAELQEAVRRLRDIREAERELDTWFQAQSAPEPQHPVNQSTTPALTHDVSKQAEDATEWKAARARRSRRKKKQLPQNPEVPLQNRFAALQTEEVRPSTSGEAREPCKVARPARVITSATKKKRRVVVVGDSLLTGTEAPICRPDALSREVCCLPGARIRDVTERLPSLIRPTDYYPLLVFHVGASDTAGSSLRNIKRDFRALGSTVKGSGVQVVFSSILPVEGQGPERARRIWQVNSWLREWCYSQGFGYLDHGACFEKPGLLGADGVHLTKRGKSVFGQRLARLVRRALN
ncbi:SGNH/GDSL hydrolase family protein [Klebsiella pneumoniae]|nr:SGNH/GDSL hydrolase family protein [Klebsiella pneumoniae]